LAKARGVLVCRRMPIRTTGINNNFVLQEMPLQNLCSVRFKITVICSTCVTVICSTCVTVCFDDTNKVMQVSRLKIDYYLIKLLCLWLMCMPVKIHTYFNIKDVCGRVITETNFRPLTRSVQFCRLIFMAFS
jgi:hypothetical protein